MLAILLPWPASLGYFLFTLGDPEAKCLALSALGTKSTSSSCDIQQVIDDWVYEDNDEVLKLHIDSNDNIGTLRWRKVERWMTVSLRLAER